MSNNNDWIAKVKAISHDVVGLIPEVGKLAQVALDLFWPAGDKPNIWEEIKSKTEKMIDQKILAHELGVINSQLDDIRDDFKQYARYADNPEKLKEHLGHILHDTSKLFKRIKDNPDKNQRVHLLPILVALAPLQLTALREQYTHGKQIYGQDSPGYKKDLIEGYTNYKTYLVQSYNEWKQWREEQINIDYSFTQQIGEPIGGFYYKYKASITDELTQQHYELAIQGAYAGDSGPNTAWGYGVLKKPAGWVKQMIMGNAIADMAYILSGAFYLRNFLPDETDYNVPEYIGDLGTITLGPFGAPFGNEYTGLTNYNPVNVKDNPGTLDVIDVYYGKTIKGIQMHYLDYGYGHLAGQKTGANSGTIQVLDPDLVGFDFTFGPEGGEMLSLQAIKRDGTKSQRFGSNSGHGIALSGAVQGSYRLASADYEIIGNNIAAISFEYKFAPEVTTIKAESVGAILNGAAITTVPLQINGKSMFAAKNITTPSMEVLVLRAHDGAVRFHKEYSLHVHWAKAPYALQWDQFYEDVTKQAQAGAPNDILIMSLLNTSGLAYPPTNVCNFLVKVGAGPALEKWVNSPSWHNSSDASFGSIAYLLGGHFNSGESKGFEKLLHGQAVKASMKLYLHAGKLQENPPQLNQKVV